MQRIRRVVTFPVPRERWWRRTLRWIRYGAHHRAHVAPMVPLRVVPLQRR